MGSPAHLLALGLVRNVISTAFQVGSFLDIKKDLTGSIKSVMEALENSKIDFAPVETLLSDKTIG